MADLLDFSLSLLMGFGSDARRLQAAGLSTGRMQMAETQSTLLSQLTSQSASVQGGN